MRAGKRLFIGVRVSVATANALAGCAETLARRARDARVELRWVAPANYHVTLAFLGWTGEELVRPVVDAVARAVDGTDRLAFRVARLGGFAALERATVLWAGIEDPAPLTRLADAIGGAVEGLGFARERRPYHPHVTLARLREARAIREVVLPMAEQMFGNTQADAITLFESEMKSSGSVYKELEKIPLKRPRATPAEAEKRQTGALERGTPERALDELLTQTDDGWPRGQGPSDPDTRST